MGALASPDLRQPPPGGGVSKGETAAEFILGPREARTRGRLPQGLPRRRPGDEGVLNIINGLPHAEERRQADLEARAAVVQQDAGAEGQFFHSLSV